MKNQRKITSFLIRVWQEPSQLQPPGEWRVSARPLEGGVENLFKSASTLWHYLTSVKPSINSENLSNTSTVEEEHQSEK